jgi:ribosomal protein L37AE/L43A
MRYELVVKCHKCGSTEQFLIPPAHKTLFCSKCKAKFDHLAVNPVMGSLYILSNPSMPGLVKIGMTEGDVSERVNQLSSGTSVAEPFVLEASITSSDPSKDEQLVHKQLAEYRKPKREFFAMSVQEAVKTLQQVLGRLPTYVRSDSLLQVTEKSHRTTATREQVYSTEYGPKRKYTCPDCHGITKLAYRNRHPRCRECGAELSTSTGSL